MTDTMYSIVFGAAESFWRGDECLLAPPYPAKQRVPQWFKALPKRCPVTKEQDYANSLTAKACPPFLEAQTQTFGQLKTINLIPRVFVHLRNIKREADGSFYESEHLDGDNDMVGLISPQRIWIYPKSF